MATLHVRNIPEPLYELLRERAEREGRSIGAETTMLLEQALARREPWQMRMPSMFAPRRTPSPRRTQFLQRFGSAAKPIVIRAQGHARGLGAAEVTPAHVLLAMLEDDVLRPPLEEAGITEDVVRARVTRGKGSPTTIPFSGETKELLENALRASLAARRDVIAPEHLLSAACAAPSLEWLPWPTLVPPFESEPLEDYRAVSLEGSADDWTSTLNELAAEGWELLSLTALDGDVRAVFRRA
jgi:plasmid stability protein